MTSLVLGYGVSILTTSKSRAADKEKEGKEPLDVTKRIITAGQKTSATSSAAMPFLFVPAAAVGGAAGGGMMGMVVSSLEAIIVTRVCMGSSAPSRSNGATYFQIVDGGSSNNDQTVADCFSTVVVGSADHNESDIADMINKQWTRCDVLFTSPEEDNGNKNDVNNNSSGKKKKQQKKSSESGGVVVVGVLYVPHAIVSPTAMMLGVNDDDISVRRGPATASAAGFGGASATAVVNASPFDVTMLTIGGFASDTSPLSLNFYDSIYTPLVALSSSSDTIPTGGGANSNNNNNNTAITPKYITTALMSRLAGVPLLAEPSSSSSSATATTTAGKKNGGNNNNKGASPPTTSSTTTLDNNDSSKLLQQFVYFRTVPQQQQQQQQRRGDSASTSPILTAFFSGVLSSPSPSSSAATVPLHLSRDGDNNSNNSNNGDCYAKASVKSVTTNATVTTIDNNCNTSTSSSATVVMGVVGLKTRLSVPPPLTTCSSPPPPVMGSSGGNSSNTPNDTENKKSQQSSPHSHASLLRSVVESTQNNTDDNDEDSGHINTVRRFLVNCYATAGGIDDGGVNGLLLYGPSGCGQHEIVEAAMASFSSEASTANRRPLPFSISQTHLSFRGVEVSDEAAEEEEETVAENRGGGAHHVHNSSSSHSALLQSVCDDLGASWELSSRISTTMTRLNSFVSSQNEQQQQQVILVPIFINAVEDVFPYDDDLITRTNMERLGRLTTAVRGGGKMGKSSSSSSSSSSSYHCCCAPFVVAFTGTNTAGKGRISRLALSSLFADGILPPPPSSSSSHSSKTNDTNTNPSAASAAASSQPLLVASPVGQIEVALPTVTERAMILRETIKRELGRRISMAIMTTDNDNKINNNNNNNNNNNDLSSTCLEQIATTLARFLVGSSMVAVIATGVKEASYIWDRVRFGGVRPNGGGELCEGEAKEGGDAIKKSVESAVAAHWEAMSGSGHNGDSSSSPSPSAPSSPFSTSIKINRQVTWDDIGGLEGVKQRMRDALIRPRLVPEAYKRFNVSPPKGVLLYGPPGCAKTTLVKALCSEGLYSFLYVDCASVLSSFVGESEQYLRDVFAKARSQSPCIVFFDEVDAVSGRRDGAGGGGESDTAKLLSTLLIEMDGFGGSAHDDICFVGATNLPHQVDSALLRPGRFDLLIHVPLPSASERYGILRAIIMKNFVASSTSSSATATADAADESMNTRHKLEHCTDLRAILSRLLPKDYEAVTALITTNNTNNATDGGEDSDSSSSSSDDDENNEEEGGDGDTEAAAATEEGTSPQPESDHRSHRPIASLHTLKKIAAKRVVAVTDNLFEGFSGADITAVVKEACTLAQRRHIDAHRAMKDNADVLVPSPLLLLTLADLQDAAVNANATIYDAAAIDKFAETH